MLPTRFFQILALFGTALFLIAAILIFRHGPAQKLGLIFNSDLLVQNTYMGPISPIPGNPQLIRVEVNAYDEPTLGGVEIKSIAFNSTSIPLKPRDVHGFRGQASFQLPPGKYKLKWNVNRDKFAWPRNVSHEQNVTLDKRDLWVQITVEGEQVSIR